jgi:FAD-linked sulfhydryl oxidase
MASADKDCEEPACNSMQSAFKRAMKSGGAAGAFSKKPQLLCPPDREELGSHSWTLLHTMAAYYPTEPDANKMASAKSFITAFADLYPCSDCAKDFKEKIEETKPAVESRDALCIWMCERHNEVNRKLGKKEFKCDMENLTKRWKKNAECEE